MSSHLFPGLIGHSVGTVPHRVFLGPKKQVEALFVRQMQSVYPWVANAMKVRGQQGQEFYELDLSANHDAEVLLRWCRVFHIRRDATEALIAKANSHIAERKILPKTDEPESKANQAAENDKGEVFDKAQHHARKNMSEKEPATTLWYRLPDAETADALKKIWKMLEVRRMPYERKRLKNALQSTGYSLYDTENPVPREIMSATSQAFNKQSCAHLLSASRYVIEDVLRERNEATNALDFERKAKHYLPRKRVEEILESLVTKHLPQGLQIKQPIEGKCAKAIDKLLRCIEYRKLATYLEGKANIGQVRPFELRSLAKFHILHRASAEGLVGDEKKHWFLQCVWGNFLMKIVSHPGWLVHNSKSWEWDMAHQMDETGSSKEDIHQTKGTSEETASDVQEAPKEAQMPMSLAAACQTAPYVLPGSNIAAMISLSLPAVSLGTAKAQSEWTDWHENMFALPLPRVLPYIGAPMSIDLLAQIHVETHWKRLNFPMEERFRDAKIMKELHAAFDSIAALQWSEILEQAVDGAEKIYGALTDAENRWMSESTT